MKRTLAMLLALALLLLCACSAAPEPTQPAAEPPVETAETLPDHAAQDDAASEPAQPLFWQVSGNGYSGSFYLLGSIHVSDGLTYPQELLDAYAACDTLAVESDVLALEADLSGKSKYMCVAGVRIALCPRCVARRVSLTLCQISPTTGVLTSPRKKISSHPTTVRFFSFIISATTLVR